MNLNRIRLKDCASVRLSNVDKHSVEGQSKVYLCNYTDVYKNRRIHNTMPFMEATATDAQIKKLHLKVNDVVITKDSESADDIAVPALIKSTRRDLVCGYHLALIRPRTIDSSFLAYVFQSKVAKDYALEVCTGFTRVSLSKSDISNFVLNIPPLQDQTTIANYLDHHTAKIDREVELLERRIELTEEYRHALIYETVTKGLNRDAPMKASGVEWIGDIPEHWEVKRVKDLYNLKKGRNASLYSHEYVLDPLNGGIYPVYSGQTEDNGIMSYISSYEYRKKCSLLTTTVGAKAMTIKRIYGCFTLSQNCALVLPKYFINFDYSFYNLGLSFKFARSLIPSHMQPSLRKDDLGYMFTLLPPLQEQNAIALYLDQETSKLDQKLELLRKKVELLKEYKQSLIYEAVTGKIPTSEM